ncbi:hypothetical protein IUQ79_00920 [Mycobacteroides abscessus subsp. bolletii]|uniref:hypothetical protein n=1 Tax=Mycobacteroides abscessus TaxID=36809 RepID=UPI0019D2C6A6|nr:hypothetical protein [Mycobacteroides abscessus]MBN7300448.1 hypothetical protein [Mycobacteroides abscessus subsp. bolletii]
MTSLHLDGDCQILGEARDQLAGRVRTAGSGEVSGHGKIAEKLLVAVVAAGRPLSENAIGC